MIPDSLEKMRRDTKREARKQKENKNRGPQEKRSTAPFRFLELPAELSNTIYKYAWETDRCVYISKWRRHQQARKHFGPFTALLGTCKQVHQEAAPLLYGIVHFAFDRVAPLGRWLKQIGDMRKHVRRITLDKRFINTIDQHFRFLPQLAALQELQLTEIFYTRNSYSVAPDTWRHVQSFYIALSLKKTMTALMAAKKSREERIKVLDIVRCVFQGKQSPWSVPPDLTVCKAAASQKTLEIRAELSNLLGLDHE